MSPTGHRDHRMRTALALASLAAALVGGAPAQAAADDATELAKKTQNPVADLTSIPLQNNFNTGAKEQTVWVLNVQPVVPITRVASSSIVIQ